MKEPETIDCGIVARPVDAPPVKQRHMKEPEPIDCGIVARGPVDAPQPRPREFLQYSFLQIVVQRAVPVWLRGGKYFVREGEGGGVGAEHELDLTAWTPEEIRLFKRFVIPIQQENAP